MLQNGILCLKILLNNTHVIFLIRNVSICLGVKKKSDWYLVGVVTDSNLISETVICTVIL
jgi:hypothetical protein